MHLGLCLKLTCSEVGLALELTKVANPLNDQEHDFYRFKSCFHDYQVSTGDERKDGCFNHSGQHRKELF